MKDSHSFSWFVKKFISDISFKLLNVSHTKSFYHISHSHWIHFSDQLSRIQKQVT
uniref:AAA-metalloprotease FtsH n=1 Tax=Rhizophora mucronata TaxID=61149 RepID=A0A2P2JGV9_RHIMU